jgi:hypothetical protein
MLTGVLTLCMLFSAILTPSWRFFLARVGPSGRRALRSQKDANSGVLIPNASAYLVLVQNDCKLLPGGGPGRTGSAERWLSNLH